jgi:hypothetical protein
MPAEETEDVEISLGSNRGAVGNTRAARGVVHEVVDPSTGDVTTISGRTAEVEDAGEGSSTPRRFKASTLALLEKLEKPGVEGDGGPDDPDDPDNTAAASVGEGEGGEGEGVEETADTGEGTDEVTTGTEDINGWQTKAQNFEVANQRLVAELEAAKSTPARDRTEYEQQLVDAWKSYVDEGPVVAIRKFIGAVLGSAPDSKDVSSELAGAYLDLTSQEVGVPLDQSQQAMREAARARLALARDKRERAESEKKAPTGNSAEAQQIEQAGSYIDNIATTKGQNGTSYAEEFPLTFRLAERFDGMKPGKLLATSIRHEVKIGALTGREPEDVLIRHAARKIEAYYDETLKLGNTARPQPAQKTDTTKSGTPAAKPASQAQRQGQGARTINNAKASVAPSTPPKTKKQEPKTEEKPKFKSKKEAQDWALRHIPK